MTKPQTGDSDCFDNDAASDRKQLIAFNSQLARLLNSAEAAMIFEGLRYQLTEPKMANKKGVLLSDGRRYVYNTYEHYAERYGCSRRTVHRALALLRAAGLIETVTRISANTKGARMLHITLSRAFVAGRLTRAQIVRGARSAGHRDAKNGVNVECQNGGGHPPVECPIGTAPKGGVECQNGAIFYSSTNIHLPANIRDVDTWRRRSVYPHSLYHVHYRKDSAKTSEMQQARLEQHGGYADAPPQTSNDLDCEKLTHVSAGIGPVNGLAGATGGPKRASMSAGTGPVNGPAGATGGPKPASMSTGTGPVNGPAGATGGPKRASMSAGTGPVNGPAGVTGGPKRAAPPGPETAAGQPARPAGTGDVLENAFNRVTRKTRAELVISRWQRCSQEIRDLAIAFAEIMNVDPVPADQGKWSSAFVKYLQAGVQRAHIERLRRLYETTSPAKQHYMKNPHYAFAIVRTFVGSTIVETTGNGNTVTTVRTEEEPPTVFNGRLVARRLDIDADRENLMQAQQAQQAQQNAALKAQIEANIEANIEAHAAAIRKLDQTE
jgi:hypothetical protein